jgi:hypothetical protein
MRAEAEEFVADIPRHIPRRALRTPNFQAAATGPMEFGVRIGGVNEHVRIDNKHLTSSFHHVVQSLAIGDINKMASTPKTWEWAKFRFRLAATGLKKQPQRRFDKLGHRLTLPSCFPPEASHNGIIDVKRGLDMENHIDDMAICQNFLIVMPAVNSGEPLVRTLSSSLLGDDLPCDSYCGRYRAWLPKLVGARSPSRTHDERDFLRWDS